MVLWYRTVEADIGNFHLTHLEGRTRVSVKVLTFDKGLGNAALIDNYFVAHNGLSMRRQEL